VRASFKQFAESEQASGVLLLACTVVSLAIANSPAGDAYLAFWQSPLGSHSISEWINDALMVLFFLLIGLELERELYVGELSSVRSAMLPIAAALGGMLAPAGIHYLLNAGGPYERGFGIPMATDIAFALGVLALLGRRAPAALRLFVAAFAIADDLGAIAVIALFYTSDLSVPHFAGAIGVWLGLLVLNRPFRMMSLPVYFAGGILMWYLMLRSGVHATLAGVLLAFAIPFTARGATQPSPSHRLEAALYAPVALIVLPVFALANTGIVLDSSSLQTANNSHGWGIALGLVLGKPVGIVAASLLAVLLGFCRLPSQVGWRHIVGAGMLGGIGFTMSIFIANLAFPGDWAVINASKLAILGSSLVAGALALCWLFFTAATPGRGAIEIDRRT
jgi:NhaA family Na+:H+ antiporter